MTHTSLSSVVCHRWKVHWWMEWILTPTSWSLLWRTCVSVTSAGTRLYALLFSAVRSLLISTSMASYDRMNNTTRETDINAELVHTIAQGCSQTVFLSKDIPEFLTGYHREININVLQRSCSIIIQIPEQCVEATAKAHYLTSLAVHLNVFELLRITYCQVIRATFSTRYLTCI